MNAMIESAATSACAGRDAGAGTLARYASGSITSADKSLQSTTRVASHGNAAMNADDKGDFHQTNNAPAIAHAMTRGNANARNTASTKTPAKSDSFPVTKP